MCLFQCFNLDSVLVGIVYKDLHELVKSNSSTDEETTNSRYIAKKFTGLNLASWDF